MVGFDKNSLFILDKNGNKEIAIYEEELTILSDFLEGCNLEQQKSFFRKKGTKK